MRKLLTEHMELGRVYTLDELYAMVEEFCRANGVDDWQHKVRGALSGQGSIRKFGKYLLFYHGNAEYSIA